MVSSPTLSDVSIGSSNPNSMIDNTLLAGCSTFVTCWRLSTRLKIVFHYCKFLSGWLKICSIFKSRIRSNRSLDAGSVPGSGRTTSIIKIRAPGLSIRTTCIRISTESSSDQLCMTVRNRYTSASLTGWGSKKLCALRVIRHFKPCESSWEATYSGPWGYGFREILDNVNSRYCRANAMDAWPVEPPIWPSL